MFKCRSNLKEVIINVWYLSNWKIVGEFNPRFHPENVEPLSPTNPRIDIKISQFVNRVEMPHLNVIIKSFSDKFLVKGQMSHGFIKIKIPTDVAQLSGDIFTKR